MPGIEATGFAPMRKPGALSAALSLGYGFTEAQSAAESGHHRQLARLAFAASPLSWLSAGLRFDERFDLLPNDGTRQPDSGWVFDSRAELRAALLPEGPPFSVGPDVVVWLPGSEQLSESLKATTVDSRLLAAYSARGVNAGITLGYRFDRSARAEPTPELLRRGDRLALGLSSFDAALIAVGASYEMGATTLKAELSADALLGAHAPPFLQSPLRLLVGASRRVAPGFDLDLSTTLSLSSHAHVPDGAPLVPIEPRVLILLGVRYGTEPRAPSRATPPSAAGTPKPAQPPSAPQQDTSVEVTLLDDNGQPLPDAQVTLRQKDQTVPLESDGHGHYRLPHVRLGGALLHVEGDGLEPIEQPLSLSGPRVDLVLRPPAALPSGQVRGVVRSFQGKPLAAVVRIEPVGTERRTSAAGTFEIDVQPGDYEIVLAAPGYATQRRKVTVQKNGVVVLNADLVKQAH